MPLFKHPARLLAAILLLASMSACTSTAMPSLADLPLGESKLVGKFVWHDLMTDDVAAARKFYSGLFGWTYEETKRFGEESYTLIISDGIYVGGMVQLADPEAVEYSRWVGYLSVADVDDAVATTRAAGGEIVVNPMNLDIARVAAITDPQGAVLGLVRAKSGDPKDHVHASPGHVIWNELLAADDNAAAKFYRSLAGLEAEGQPRPGGEYLMMKQAGVARAGIIQRPDDEIDPLWLTFFAVNDPGASASRAASLGGEVVMAPAADFRKGNLALITDPGGAVLALQRWPE